ncbi:hypothetical protein Y032_0011g1229 [Ancylostoma ceylanicum]|uniref:Uncharacterized protein n=1 Tax=Ancylostoma ceylanicum TaxID=53326 RepID=A0A016VDZ0_9BILA|nr:hypothetical protein Y032_0011g1229 [Ancylostoma ceylanicum]
MLGASSLDPSSSASPWHSTSSAVGHPSSSSRPSKSVHSPPKTEADTSASFSHDVKEEYSHIEPVASTSSGRSAVSEEGASCDADASRRQGMTSSSIPSVHCRRLTFRLPPKFAQRLKRIANKQPNTLGRLGVSKVKVGDGETVSVNDAPPVQPCKIEERRPDQPVERVESRQSVPPQPPHPPPGSAGPVCQPPPGYHTIQHQHQQEVGPAVAPHPMQRPAPINNNSPLLVNLLSSQQPAGMVGGPPGANVPPHHQSYSPAASYMYPGGAPPHQHPHPSAVPQNAPPQVMDPQQHMAMQQQMQMEQRQRMLMQQQQAHAAAVAAAQAQQHQVPGQPPQAPLTPGGFYSPATPVQQTQPQQRPPIGYAPPQNPAMFAGQQQPQQVPANVQQQRMQSYPAQMKPGAMPGAPPVAPGQFRGPPVEETVQPPPPKKKRKPTKKQQQKEAELAAAAAAAQQQQNAAAAAQAQQQQQFYNDRMMHPAALTPGGMQMMGHSGYPPGTAYPANQGGMSAVPPQYPGYPQGSSQQQQQQQQLQQQQQQQQALWHQQMQQRMMYQQQHGQAQAGPPGHAGQPWPAQRGPPVPYPTPMDGMHGGPGSVHPAVSQRTSGSGEYSRDGTSPATPHQFNPGSHQGMMMGHAGTPMSRADSQGSVFGNSTYPQQPPSAQHSVEETEHPVDKLFTGQDDQLADLGDLDDIEPMVDLGVGVLDELTGNPQGDALGNMGAHIGGPQSVDPSSNAAQTSNGDRIDSSIASVVEMVSKSGAAPSICGAPAVSQTGTHPTVGGNVAAMKRRPSNAQMAANIVAVAGQQQHLMGDQRYAMGAPHHMMNPGQIPMQMQMMQPMASSPSAGNLSLEHNARAQLFHGRAGMAKTGENGPGRLVNGHDQTGVPNGARRSQPQPQPSDAAEEERIAELVKKARSSRFVVAQGESQKAAAAEQKAKLPRKNRRKTDLSKEASPRDDEEPFIVDGSRRRAPGVATSHVQAAASNFQATMARQQQLMKQQQVQPKQ